MFKKIKILFLKKFNKRAYEKHKKYVFQQNLIKVQNFIYNNMRPFEKDGVLLNLIFNYLEYFTVNPDEELYGNKRHILIEKNYKYDARFYPKNSIISKRLHDKCMNKMYERFVEFSKPFNGIYKIIKRNYFDGILGIPSICHTDRQIL